MKIVYCHDHRLKSYKDHFYSNGSFSSDFFRNYLSVFDEVVFLTRQEESDRKAKNLTLVDGEGLSFKEVTDFKSIRKLKNLGKARKQIKEQVRQADGVIARMPSLIGRIAIKYAKKSKKPYLIEVVGCPWDSSINHGSLAGKVLAPYSYLKLKNEIKNSKRTSYITNHFLQERYPTEGKEYIVPNIVIREVADEVLEKRLDKIEQKKKAAPYVFGLIGSLDVAYKGHMEVIKAFHLIKNEYPTLNFRIEFLGGGEGEKIKKEIQELNLSAEVVFKETLPSGEKVFEWMDSLDLTLQPSKAEAQGRAIIEAMSRGNPVIASNVGGIVELIDPKWRIEAGNHRELKEKIIELISDKALMKEQSKTNFHRAQKYYKAKVDAKRHDLLLDFKKEIEDSSREK